MSAFRWSEVPDEVVRAGVRRRGIGMKGCLVVMNECEPGMELRPHTHDFDQIALITEGRALYHVGGVANEVEPGSVLLIEAGVEHYIEPLGDEVVHNIDIFAPPREDYLHLLAWMNESGIDGREKSA